jgi:hypothetical protein
MAMRHWCDEPLPTRRPPIKPHHIGLCSRFINEDKMFRVQIGLANPPFLARLAISARFCSTARNDFF